MANNEQMRRMNNRVHLAGALAELENVKEGVTQSGIPYISFRGAIRCGEESVYDVKFRSFVKSKKHDGTDSKAYKAVKEWLEGAVPLTKNPDGASMVDMIGFVGDNPYVNSSDELIETVQFNITSVTDFKKYAADIDLEGYLYSVNEETRGTENTPTGRERMRLISMDMYHNILDIKNIILSNTQTGNPSFIRDFRRAGYKKGSTATFYISLIPSETRQASGGFGVQRTTGGNYLEWVLIGATTPIAKDSKDAVTDEMCKAAMMERKNHLEEIKDAGYLGSGNSGKSNSRAGFTSSATGSTSNDNFVSISDEEDCPF